MGCSGPPRKTSSETQQAEGAAVPAADLGQTRRLQRVVAEALHLRRSGRHALQGPDAWTFGSGVERRMRAQRQRRRTLDAEHDVHDAAVGVA